MNVHTPHLYICICICIFDALHQINRIPFSSFLRYSFPFQTEQPSSSSLSTTTSSVTSMTSLEHESNDTSVSASDYGNDMASDYGNDGWDVAGDMDVCTLPIFVYRQLQSSD